MNNSSLKNEDLKERAFDVARRLPDLMYQTDMNHIIVYANPAFASIFGYDSENELIGKNIKELYVYPGDREDFLKKLRGKDKKVIGEIVFVKKKDGEPFFLSVDSHIIEENGKEIGVVGVGRDITYQIPVAQRLIELWKREHTLVQRSLVGIYVIQDGVFKFVNEALAKIFGYASEELIGKQYIDLVAKDDKEKVKDEVERKIKGEERKPYSFKGIKRDGTEIDVMVDSARIPYEGKDALLGTLRDITEEKRLKENLEEEVKKRTEAFGRFTEDIAHELKTPISTILTIIDNYRRGLIKEDEVPQTLENIFMELERLNLFSEKLWRLIEVESGKCEVRLDSINVYQEINSLWSRLQSKAGQKGILFRVGKEIKNWRPLRTDKDLFGHIVLNLLDNAIKYSFERSYIEVSGKTEPGTVIIDFVSKGKTISPEDQVKIFEKYYRTKEAKDMVPAGSGIGLYLVKKLMELLGGRIEVKSVPVPGATKGESLNIFRLIFII